jgi:hypothetical protein
MDNLLEVFVTTWNNEAIIQDFIDWYRDRIPNCRITMYDNMSSDNTVEICKNNGCNVISFDTNGKMDESKLMEIRNNCWKESKCEYVCIVDSDELVDINEEILKEFKFNIIKCTGYEMFGNEGDKLEDLVYGVPSIGYSKTAIFHKDSIEKINYGAGSHSCSPISTNNKGVREQLVYNDVEIPLYHTKWRSWSNGIGKAHEIAPRRSEGDILKGWNFHYSLHDNVHMDYYRSGMKNRIKIKE